MKSLRSVFFNPAPRESGSADSGSSDSASAPASLLHDRRGAALVEFVIAVVPLLTTFFSFVQVAKIYTVNLGVQHAAITAARAAIVMVKKPTNPGEKGSNTDVKQAAGLALSPWITSGSVSNVSVSVQDGSSMSDVYGPVRVRVQATYSCTVPMGRLICPGSRKILTAEATMPNQGARYKVD
ncbi:MAG: pilus assembly protein [Myxococcales bacterium]|nr:pilus assembly protein [Myxococcales bacterium]HQY60503.1 TadE/TadG family type IV pilus assembly protein [Polyangiaceae bacterium]